MMAIPPRIASTFISELPKLRLLISSKGTTTPTLNSTLHMSSMISQEKNMSTLTINSTIRMNSGYEIPRLGFGVYQTPPDVTEDVVSQALKAGYRHVDSAIAYRNEAPSAAAIKKSGISRSDIFFTSKVYADRLSYEDTKRKIGETLQKTGFDYIDLMLLHAPFGGREGRKGAWKALLESQDRGEVRSLGVSNYSVKHLDEMEVYMKELEQERGKGSKIDVGQWEVHPWLPRKDITEWCEKRGVVVEAYAPIVRATKNDDPLLISLGKKYNKTSPQVLIRWSLQKGFVPLPKSVTASRIVENTKVYDFELSDEDMKTLQMDNSYERCSGWDPTTADLEQ